MGVRVQCGKKWRGGGARWWRGGSDGVGVEGWAGMLKKLGKRCGEDGR